jgi:uncharacterized protein
MNQMMLRCSLLSTCILLMASVAAAQQPNLTVNDVSLTEGNVGTTTYTFTVSLSAPAGAGGVTFDIATADGTAQDDNPAFEDNDYVAKSLTGQIIPSGSSTYSFDVLVNGDGTPETNETFFVNVTNVTNALVTDGQGLGTIVNDDLSRIHDVQGNGAATPIPGATVTVEGVVIGDYQGSTQLSGFFLQEEDADTDADPATSEGIFIFCSTCPTPVAEGQRVRATGMVAEILNKTEIGAITAGSVVVSDPGNHLAEVTPSAIDLPVAGVVDDFYESREGMLVTFVDTLTVSEYFELAQYGQIELYEGGRPRQFTEMSAPSVAGLTAHLDNLSRHRVLLDDTDNTINGLLAQPDGSQFAYHPRANGGFSVGTQGTDFFRGGDLINGLTGVLHWSFAGVGSPNAWRVRPSAAAPASFTVANPRPVTPPVVGGAIKAVSMNLLNYFTTIDTTSSDSSGPCGPSGTQDCRGADSVTELNRQRERASIVVCSLNADVYALMELENTTPSATITDLLGAINALCGGAHPYAFVDTGGTLGTDVIRVQQIYRTGILSPVGSPLVDLDPVHNRPPTAQTFDVVDPANTAFGQRFTVIANHFKSKACPGTGADADAGDGQGCFNSTRTAQANRLLTWVSGTVLPAAGDPDVLLLGDFNAYAKEDPVTTLSGGGFTDLESSFLGANAYSYVFDGQTGHLDYAFASASLASQVLGASAWHINADEVPLFDYNDEVRDTGEAAAEEKPDGSALVPPRVVFQPASPYRASDHDPILVGLFGAADLTVTVTPSSGSVMSLTSAPFTVTVTNNGPDTASNVSVTLSLTGGNGTITPGVPSAGAIVGSNWQIATLGTGASATLTLDVFASSGPLTLTAQGTSDTADPNGANNTSAAVLTVVARTTDTTVQLTPATIAIGDSATVTIAVTVTQPSGMPAFPPTGALTLGSSVVGDVLTGCVLAPSTTDVASCQATLTPASVGPRIITATFAGNGTHAPSGGTGTLAVDPRSTTTTTSSQMAAFSDVPQTVVLTASVSSSRTVDAGAVTFTVQDASSGVVGAPVTSAVLTNGTATVNYILPGGTPPQTLTIVASYSGATDFAASGATGTLTVTSTMPTIESVTPSTGPTSGGTLITITGTNFTAAPTVTLGSALATNVVVVNGTTITAETPSHAAGIVDVTVTFAGAVPATRTGGFEYVADRRLTLTRVGAGIGRVVSIADGIACGHVCSAMFPAGSTVELVAIPAADAIFAGWAGDVDCSDGRITLNSDVACTARFARLTDKTTVDLDGDGLADVIGYAPPPAVAGSMLGGRALLAASTGVLRAGDFNGDRKTDVFEYDPITGAWNISLAGAGGMNGMFAPRRSPIALELDGDGRTDLALVDPVTGEIQLCAPAALPMCPLTVFAPAGAAIHPLDADGNGRADLLAYVPATGQVQFLLSGSGGGVGPVDADVTVLDVDGDRRSDLLFYNAVTGAATVAVNRVTGFTLTSSTAAAGLTIRRARLSADLLDDLVAYSPVSGSVMLAVSRGDGTFVVSSATIAANLQLSLADFGGDGITDGFLYDPATGAVTVAISVAPGSYLGLPLIMPAGLTIVTQGGFTP